MRESKRVRSRRLGAIGSVGVVLLGAACGGQKETDARRAMDPVIEGSYSLPLTVLRNPPVLRLKYEDGSALRVRIFDVGRNYEPLCFRLEEPASVTGVEGHRHDDLLDLSLDVRRC
jgi:hypothetical protein